ncbi:hypothetical protein [Pseudonocardia sp. H11422]|uniref:hypothetical protein n=1 Tax=Pseudonocardia sp. H11422 TaxID=2835866 RepID=UPI003977C14D
MAQVMYPYAQAGSVLAAWRDLTPCLPGTLAPEFALWSMPADPEIPAELHGEKVVVLGVYAGPPREAAPCWLYYMKSHFMDGLGDDAIGTVLDCDSRRPTTESLIVIRTLGGAVARVGEHESAFAHRSARYNLSIDTGWSDPTLDEVALGWARSSWDALSPFSTGGVYLNFAGLGDEVDDVRSSALGANEARLGRIRESYDPDGLFTRAAHQP